MFNLNRFKARIKADIRGIKKVFARTKTEEHQVAPESDGFKKFLQRRKKVVSIPTTRARVGFGTFSRVKTLAIGRLQHHRFTFREIVNARRKWA